MNTSLKTSKSSSTTVALNIVPASELSVNPGEVTMATGKSPEPIRGHVRAMRPMRFSIGAMISATGIGMILSVALGMFQIRKFGGDMSLLIVGFVVLLGVMFLGGGFGVMATSSAGFDESEFDRLSTAGNLCAEYDSMFAADKNPDDDCTVTQPVNEGDSAFEESPSGCVTSESEAA